MKKKKKIKSFIKMKNIFLFDILFDIFILELNDMQREIQELARKFTKEEIIPVAAEYDKNGKYPWDIIKKAWSLGLVHKHIPKYCGIIIDLYV